MRPVLFSVLGLDIQSYGASKALAALVAAWLLGRAFARQGLPKADAHALTMSATLWGFVGAKVYYLAEQGAAVQWHDLGGTGFTWYGGLLAGLGALLLGCRRRGLPLVPVAGAAAAPLSVAYGIGRLGCLVAGDGTYGKPSDLPWAMSFPDGVVPSLVPVQPTPLYEALAAFALAGLLWSLRDRVGPSALVVTYLAVAGASRFLVELARTNTPALWGLTQPQLWAVGMLLVAAALAVRRLAARDLATAAGD